MFPFFIAERRWRVVVDYDLSLPQMIEIADFQLVDPKIRPERFQIARRGRQAIDIYLLCICPKQETMTATVLHTMEELELRPAGLAEIIALATLIPPVRLAKRVFALDTVWRDDFGLVYVPQCNFGRHRRLGASPIRHEPWWSAYTDSFACTLR